MAFGSKELAKLLKKGGKEVIESLTDTPTVKKATPPKAEGPKAKGSSKAKPGGPGRKRKARGVKPATPAQKAGAKKAGMGIKAFRALPQAEQKKWIKKTSEKKYGEHVASAAAKAGIGVKAFRKLSKAEQQKLIENVKKPGKSKSTAKTRQKEETELDRLTEQQQEEMDAALRPKKTATGIRRKKLTPEGQRLFNAGEFDEIINNPDKYMTHGFDAPLRPKVTEVTKGQLAKMKKGSPEDKAQAIREMLDDPGHVVATPVQVSPQLRGKASKGELDEMEKELKELGGFEITEGLKGGGRLKYYKKGGRIKKSSKKPRGVGKALRGYGRAMGRG